MIDRISLMSLEEIESFILKPIKYQYVSYNHKAAVADPQFQNIEYVLDSYSIPIEIKEKYKCLKVGKLRKVFFNNIGDLWKFVIGHKRNKVFYVYDFGKNVKPIIKRSDDKFNLIDRDLAIDLNTL